MSAAIRRILAAVLLLILIPVSAPALTGQNISIFETYYKEDVTYINNTIGRHLLPKDLIELDLDDTGHMQYFYYDNELQVTVVADEEGIIESCEIRLLYPEGAVQGNSLYMDFVTASYHSLAYIMAMHISAEVSSRFLLADEIAKELEKNLGAYKRQLGAYSISCVKVVGEGAVFTFTNNGLAAQTTAEPTGETLDETTTPEGQQEAPPEINEEDQGANLG